MRGKSRISLRSSGLRPNHAEPFSFLLHSLQKPPPFWIHRSPPVALLVLLAFHWSAQVCRRARWVGSLAYFVYTALGYSTGLLGAEGVVDFDAAAGLVSAVFGTAEPAAAGAAAPSLLHC